MKRQSGKINLFFLMMVCAAFVFAIASTAMASVAEQMTGGKTPAASAPGGNALVSVAPGVNIDAKLRSDLEKKLAAINAKYDVHVGVVFMDRVPGGSTAEQLAKGIAEGGNGYEQGSRGSMVLLVAVNSRDYYVATGRNLNKIIPSKTGVKHIQDEILPLLKDSKFGEAAMKFADTAEMELAYYEKEGEPYDPASGFSMMAALAALAVAALTWYGVRSYLIGQMSNVQEAAAADEYLDDGSFSLTHEEDTFLYTDVTAVPKSKPSSGSSSSSDDSGSSGGGGGKF
ncbi:MAG: TPM domain-containing protein [Negativicutes bacterium]